MNITSIIGIALGFILIILSIMIGGDITRYFDPSSVMIVIGGTVCATLVSYSLDQLKAFLPRIKDVFKASSVDLVADRDRIIELATVARREGLLALDGEQYEDPFLQKGIELIVDGTDPELVKDIMDSEIGLIEEKDSIGVKILGSMAQYAPAFGMVGTLIGLINMLMFLSDSEALGPAMATALITTFYGVILANLIFLPFASKLRTANALHLVRYEMLLEGILSMQNGENPRIIKEKLNAFIPPEMLQAKKPGQPEPEREQAENAQETITE